MKKNLFLLFLILLLGSCKGIEPPTSSIDSISQPSSEASSETISSIVENENNKIVDIINVPEGYSRYTDSRLFVEDHEVPLAEVKVNNTHAYVNPEPPRISSGVGRVYIRGKITFRLETTYSLNGNIKVYPSDSNIIPFVNSSKNQITFEIFTPGKYVIEPNNDPDKAIHLFVYEYKENEYQDYIDLINVNNDYNIIKFDKGIYDSSNSQYINSSNVLSLNSKTILWLDDETIIKGRINVRNAKDIHIIGRGIIDGSSFSRENTVVPINFEKCSNIYLNHVTILDPAAWTCNFYFTHDSEINDINIISSRANGDGITLQSCYKINIDNCFVRGFDDNLVVKNYSYPYGNPDRTTHGSSYELKFTNCVLWTDLAQSMEIGYETCGEEIRDITFENIDVVHAFHKPVISIHNSNYADVYNITYKNITVEDASMGQGDAGNNYELIDFKSIYSNIYTPIASGGATEIGNIRNVTVENVLVISKADRLPLTITMEGQKDHRENLKDHLSYVSNISLKNIKLIDSMLTDNYPYIKKNEYVNNVSVSYDTTDVNGYSLKRYWDKDYLNSLSNKIIFY